MTQSKQQVQANLNLATEPSDELMQLLAELGDGDVVEGPLAATEGKTYTPDEIEEIVINGTVGDLLAHARDEAHATMAAIGQFAGVTRARVQQLENSSNVEVATLVRFAAACGYEVKLTLQPVQKERRQLSATLSAVPA